VGKSHEPKTKFTTGGRCGPNGIGRGPGVNNPGRGGISGGGQRGQFIAKAPS